MEGVYGRKWYIGEGEGFGKCKRVGGRVQRKIRGRSKKTRGNRRKMESEIEFKDKWVQEEWATGEVYGEVVVWLRW